MQGRVQSARGDVVAMGGQLRAHPRPVDRLLGRVMQDVQEHRTPEQFPHTRHRKQISDADMGSGPEQSVTTGGTPTAAPQT